MTTKSAGKIKNTMRKQHLDRRLLGRFLSALPPTHPHLVGLDAQDLADRDAQLFGLDDRRSKGLHILDPVRAAISRSASRRARPSLVSVSTRLNSFDSSVSHFSVTRCSAESKARPASTLIVSRSSASGSALTMFFLRFLICCPSQIPGSR